MNKLGLGIVLVITVTVFGRALAAGPPGATTRAEQLATTMPAESLVLDLGKQVTMKLVKCPAGKFVMGSPGGEKNRRSDEGPQREVTITKAYYMGVFAVTQEQYEAVVGNNPSSIKGAQNPVENVSWDEAAEFCKKLSKSAGRTVRLPTEAEWEHACRAGSKAPFYFGDDDKLLGDHAWYGGNSGKTTHAVGLKKPNAFGLYDMYGNVWQWCSDWYAEYPAGAATDPSGPKSGEERVLRGADMQNFAPFLRSASRVGSPPGERRGNGFRVVVELK